MVNIDGNKFDKDPLFYSEEIPMYVNKNLRYTK